MAILDATLSQFAFSPITAFRLPATTGIGEFEWQTVEPFHRIHAYGTGFTYSGIAPTGGTVTSIDLDWVDDTGTTGFIDATLRGLSVPLTSLINVGNPLAGQIAFWETVLGGDDEIRAPLAAGGQLFGDFTSVVSGAVDGIFRQGGNDEFFSAAPLSLGAVFVRGGEVAANALVGDALYVQGTVNGEFANYAEVAGGDDIFNVSAKSAFVVVGDVQWVEVLGTVYGGNDKVNSTVDFISGFGLGASAGLYIGDVELNLGTVFGGDDRITGSNFAFSMEVLVGDVRTSEIGGAVTGGDDTLLGRSGQEQIAGDVLIVKNNSQTTGGADVIRGGGDSDIIAGDVLQFSKTGPTLATASVIGGDDRLFGDIGDDWISGDVWDISEAAGSSLIIGGDDNIFGGDGDDQLYGDIGADISGFVTGNILIGGDDTLDGGLGDDLISGQGGKDTVSFKSVNLAVIVDLAARAATGQGHDILQSIENATGSSQDDKTHGVRPRQYLEG